VFLKSLQIKGFKSFADAADLEFEPGVTVVVGPNGSGKSNVVDAIGWVLGAQAPSAVRSQKMDDVIFAGSAKRPALGRAEVALTIDNSAGLLPIEFIEVTISRALFRSGDSEYAINGVPCRLLDIQDLLSDSGVGRQQHVIISQGQIDAVLNAKAEDRRLIIEEAAGVLKFRRRKEKAERRLASTEANLTRVQDLLREVRRQLRPLERQADAARRHGQVQGELNALRIHLAGRELNRLRNRLAESTAAQQELRSSDRRLKSTLAELDARIIEVEGQLAGLGGQEFGDALVRHEALRERARGLVALLAERRRGAERARDASVDAGVVASLEAESAQLRSDLDAAEVEARSLAPDQEALSRAEAELDESRQRFERDWGDGVQAATGEAAEVRAELAALLNAIERSAADRSRLESQVTALESKSVRLVDERGRLQAERAETESSSESVATAVLRAQGALATAEAALTAAERADVDAAAEHHRWAARAEALALALDEARQRAGADHLSDLDGVVGTLLDVVDVDPGWEAAFEAAVADALGAVVVDSATVARRALESLSSGELAGSVLALGGALRWSPPPPIGEPVRRHVTSTRPGVDALLDRMLGSAVCVEGSWDRALDVAIEHPDAVVVTRGGDRFGASGWRLGRGASGATGAALDEAQRKAEVAEGLHRETELAAIEARATAEAARVAVTDATRDRDRLEVRLRSVTDAVSRVDADVNEADDEAATVRGHLAEVERRTQVEASRRADLESRLPALEASEAERSDRERALAEARQRLEEQAVEVGVLRTDIEVRSSAVEERRRFLGTRLAQVDERLARNQADRAAAERRRLELDARIEVLAGLTRFTTERLERVEHVLSGLREARRQQTEQHRAIASELETLRRQRTEAERELEGVRERTQRAEVDDAETNMRLEAATETLRHDLDCEPDVAMATECPAIPEGTSPSARVRELEREIRLMGPINPLALEEFAALQERHEFLEGQLDDIRQTRRELGKVIRHVDEEIVNVFSAAFADVSQNFEALFETLFPGGQGRLRLTEPHDLLNTGIELEAKPSGKNVKKLSLLSGGERSLTALAYLFAVFRSRPSPFYVMDEVEAALDDVNLHRFLGLVAEFRDTAQLLIVSHQKRTMEAADILYGVTMEPGGSSKVLSERVAAVLD
jgi:chromosome segregation protein